MTQPGGRRFWGVKEAVDTGNNVRSVREGIEKLGNIGSLCIFGLAETHIQGVCTHYLKYLVTKNIFLVDFNLNFNDSTPAAMQVVHDHFFR